MVRVSSGELATPRAAARETCRNGHEWTPENTRWRIREDKGETKPTRDCLQCKRDSKRRRARRRAGQPPVAPAPEASAGMPSGLPPYARYVLRQVALTHGHDWSTITELDLLRVPGVGPQTVSVILSALADSPDRPAQPSAIAAE